MGILQLEILLDHLTNFGSTVNVACARLSDSIRSGNVLKAKLRRLSTTISEPGTGYCEWNSVDH